MNNKLSDEQITERFEERAAIRQFDGQQPKELAERNAALDTFRLAKRLPEPILQKCKLSHLSEEQLQKLADTVRRS